MESGTESELSNRPPVELFVEEGELSDNQKLMDQEQTISEEQTYWETMKGIRSYIGWPHVPDMDSSNPSDDNPFAGPKAPVLSKVSVQMPTEDWLCKKLNKLNVTLVEGYPSQTLEASGLMMDQFNLQSHTPSDTGCFPTRKMTRLQSQVGTLERQS